VFEVEEDGRFERDGEDLYTEVLVTYPQLALGANVDVPMVTGSVNLQVPPGTQSGQVFNLRGRGLPRINSSSSGNLHVRLQLWTPENLSEEEAALIRRLEDIQTVPAPQPKGLWSKIRDSLGA
jgi:molecular chaperone DnaJ